MEGGFCLKQRHSVNEMLWTGQGCACGNFQDGVPFPYSDRYRKHYGQLEHAEQRIGFGSKPVKPSPVISMLQDPKPRKVGYLSLLVSPRFRNSARRLRRR